MNPAATAFLVPLLEIIWIDILLSADNAVVIALACRSLPHRQRRLAIWLGAGAAVALRVVFTLSVAQLLVLPFVKSVGGGILLIIAIQLVAEQHDAKEAKPGHSIWDSVRIIVVADIVMSLDNAVAIAAAAKGSALLILIGLALSIPLIVYGSTLALSLLVRYPALVWAGAALLGWVAGELIGADRDLAALSGFRLPGSDSWWWGPGGAAFVLAVAWLMFRARARLPAPFSRALRSALGKLGFHG
jgi:YjbE family integral membrane protein